MLLRLWTLVNHASRQVKVGAVRSRVSNSLTCQSSQEDAVAHYKNLLMPLSIARLMIDKLFEVLGAMINHAVVLGALLVL